MMEDELDTTPAGHPWWTIRGDLLLKMLKRAHDGEDPDAIYTEAYVNSKREKPSDG